MAKIYEVTMKKIITAKNETEARELVDEAMAAIFCHVVVVTDVRLWKESKEGKIDDKS